MATHQVVAGFTNAGVAAVGGAVVAALLGAGHLTRQVVEEVGLAVGTVAGDQVAGVVIAVLQPRGVLQVAQRVAGCTPYDLFLGDFTERVVDLTLAALTQCRADHEYVQRIGQVAHRVVGVAPLQRVADDLPDLQVLRRADDP